MSVALNSIHPPHMPSQPSAVQGQNTSNASLWLWKHRIPRVGLTILEGPTNIGKTLCALNLAASVSRGLMPDNTPCPQGKVIYISDEDSPDDFLQPVLRRAQASESDVNVMRCGMDFTPESFSFLRDMVKHHQPRLVVIDSLGATLGTLPGLTDVKLASIVQNLFEMAWNHQMAILLIRNVNMKGYPHAQTRVEKSPRLTAASQSILLLSPDTTDPGSILLSQSKCHLTAEPPTLSFRMTSDPDADNTIPSLIWSSAPNLSGADLRHLHHIGSLPQPNLSDAVLSLLRDHKDKSLTCVEICKMLPDPNLKVNTVSQTLYRLETRGLILRVSHGVYASLSYQPASDSMAKLENPVKVSNSSANPATPLPQEGQSAVKVSNSSANPATPLPQKAQSAVKVSNSSQNPGTPLPQKAQSAVKVSNSSQNPGTPLPQKAQSAVKVSKSLAKPSVSAILDFQRAAHSLVFMSQWV